MWQELRWKLTTGNFIFLAYILIFFVYFCYPGCFVFFRFVFPQGKYSLKNLLTDSAFSGTFLGRRAVPFLANRSAVLSSVTAIWQCTHWKCISLLRCFNSFFASLMICKNNIYWMLWAVNQQIWRHWYKQSNYCRCMYLYIALIFISKLVLFLPANI